MRFETYTLRAGSFLLLAAVVAGLVLAGVGTAVAQSDEGSDGFDYDAEGVGSDAVGEDLFEGISDRIDDGSGLFDGITDTIEKPGGGPGPGPGPEPDPGEAEFRVALTGTNSPVTEGETLEVTATVENEGDADSTQTVTLEIGGDVRDSTSLSLDAGESETVTLTWATGSGDAGSDTATVATDDDSARTDVVVAPAESDLGTIEGTVTDADTGEAIAGAIVEADGASTTTADDGSYTLAVEPGTYTVTASADGYEDAQRPDVQVSADDTVPVEFSLSAGEQPRPAPDSFEAYVAASPDVATEQVGYFQTGYNSNNGPGRPIAFAESEGFQPTQDAIDSQPDYLTPPGPGTVTLSGTIDREAGTWNGSIDFPVSADIVNDTAAGDVYYLVDIEPRDGASGTFDYETGEITVETTVDVFVDVYVIPDGGPQVNPFDGVTDDPDSRISDENCHVPGVSVALSTEGSFDAQSAAAATETAEGVRLTDENETVLVDDGFDVPGATDCGYVSSLELVSIDDAIDDAQGLPATGEDPGNELVFDLAFEFDD